MGRDRRNEEKTDRFTKWIYRHRLLPAWKALSFASRDAYFHLQVRCITNGRPNNNGHIYRSPRDLAADMGCAQKTAMAALADLQAKGWIVCTQPWERGYDGKGRTALFRLTMLPTERAGPSEEPRSWPEHGDYPVLVYQKYKPKPRKGRSDNFTEKQNPPPHLGALVHPIRAHWDDKNPSSASYLGAQNAENDQSSASYSGAYLLAISPDRLQANLGGGRGLCGKARIAA